MPAPRTLSYNPPHTLAGFSGHPDTLAAMVDVAQGPRGEQSMMVRSMMEEIVRWVQPKDYLGEILAVRYWVTDRVRYANDPMHVELVKDPQRLIEEVVARGLAVGDCDDLATLIGTMCLQLGRDCEYVVVGFGGAGSYSHVFVRVKEPRSGEWIVCDPVAGTDERGMLERVTTYYTVSLDEQPGRGLSQQIMVA
jgi:hypothetical protein